MTNGAWASRPPAWNETPLRPVGAEPEEIFRAVRRAGRPRSFAFEQRDRQDSPGAGEPGQKIRQSFD